MRRVNGLALCLGLLFASFNSASAQSFVNWESPHVHPLDITTDGTRLLAVNTADNRLEIFDISTGLAVKLGAIPVGLDPVSVRARTSTEAWVVNQISDSVSIIDLTTMNVVRTLRTDDEPADVIFAPSVNRAFVSCSQTNTVLIYDLTNLNNAPTRLTLDGEEPRALAYNPIRNEVYVAVFESGNHSTILGGGSTMGAGFPPNVVTDPTGPYLGVNPPPNDVTAFSPPIGTSLPTPPRVGLIVKKNTSGQWLDDNTHDWTGMVSGADAAKSGRPVGWDVWDHDVAIINAASLSVGYADGLMNICMALAVNPGTGHVTVIGTDATNDVRFEPVLTGRFLRVNLARVDPVGPSVTAISDLNTHITASYGRTVPFVPLPQAERDKSLGDPRGIIWNTAGDHGYITGMGSNNVIVINANGNRIGVQPTIEVGEGPTGVALNETTGRLYVLNKFAASVSVIDTALETELARIPFHDPTTAAIKTGRKHLYDTHKNSGLGHISCASCHVDGKLDRLAWDLGDPSGAMKPFNQNCPAGGCQDWHPMKGPMTTQTLQDIIGKEPHHWRGDRTGIEEFSGAFHGLLGGDNPLPTVPPNDEMQEFENFLATIAFPPNPNRGAGRWPTSGAFDNSLPTNLPLPGHFTTGRFGPAGLPLPNGNAVNGLTAYRTSQLDGVNCVTCHTLPTGAGTDSTLSGGIFVPIPPGPDGEHHLAMVSNDGSTNISIKIPQLRNEYKKVGMELTQLRNLSGFGVLHDGSVDSLARFVNEPVFAVTSNQQTADLVALMLAFSGSDYPPRTLLEPPGVAGLDTHAAVGWQTTLRDSTLPDPGQLTLISNMITLANTNRVGLVVKGRQGGIIRGYRYNSSTFAPNNVFQSDRAAETFAPATLQGFATSDSELTYMIVPKGSETRIGINRDGDAFLDRDEIDQCSNPANAASTPTNIGADIDDDGDEDPDDVDAFVAVLLGVSPYSAHTTRSDMNCDGFTDGRDVGGFLRGWLLP
ncbi:MAG: hypothetical protein AABZ08_09465 [Planctomycetota bacterium]